MAITEKARVQARECLPTSYGDVDVAWLQLHAEADSAGRLRRDQRRAATKKWVINCLAWVAVVLNWPPHAFDGLLGAVGGFSVLATAGYIPKRCLFAVAGPMAFRAHRIP